MDTTLKIGLISDDSMFAAVLSSYVSADGLYFPVFSLPRMTRNDWEFEVHKRATSINRIHLEILFCKSEDYPVLAPLRDQVNTNLVPIVDYDEIKMYCSHELLERCLRVSPENYLSGFIKAKTERKILKIGAQESSDLSWRNLMTPKSETVVVLEQINQITDISAINYTFAKGYDLLLFEQIPESAVEAMKYLFSNLDGDDESLNQLHQHFLEYIDFEWIEENYRQVQFVVSELPVGMLIQSIPVAHLSHLQSDLRLADEWYYLDRHQHDTQFVPSVLFVDTESQDLTSEIPEICEELSKFKYWGFHLNGKSASRVNFTIYSQFFPYDVLFVSGHGTSPCCRRVVYRFRSRDGESHTMQFLEYFQFARIQGDKYEVETKQFPLQVDGIDWRNKETLANAGILHMYGEYLGQNRAELEIVEAREIEPPSIEGLLLCDGVFLGTIGEFACQNNPIVVLNTCGSLQEMSGLLEFAGTRALIGTMWSVDDSDAYNFASAFFAGLPDNSIAVAFHAARSNVEGRYSRLSYVHFGTLNSYLRMKFEFDDEAEAGKRMANRLIAGFIEGISDYVSGGLGSTIHLDDIMKLGDVSGHFVERRFPRENKLRQELRNAHRLIHANQGCTDEDI